MRRHSQHTISLVESFQLLPTSTFVVVTLPVEACEGGREEVMKAKEQAILSLGHTLANSNASEGEVSGVNS